jgi:membrane protein
LRRTRGAEIEEGSPSSWVQRKREKIESFAGVETKEKQTMPGEESKHIFEPGGTEVSTAAGSARRYRKPLKSFRWHDVKFLFDESFSAWSKHKAPRLGASLAFYTLLSLTPLVLVMVAIVGLVFGHVTAQHEVVRQVRMLIGTQGAKAIEALLQASRNTTHGIIATLIGMVTLLFGASGVMIELRDALNTIWEVPTPELVGVRSRIMSYIRERLFSFAMLLSIGFILVVSLTISAWISALGAVSASVAPPMEALLQVVNALVSFAVITCLFAALYKIMPDVRLEWRDVVLGGAVTSLLFTVGKSLLGIYLGKASIASSYGAFASIVVLVIWVYYSAQIYFLGAEFTKTFANHYGSQPNRNPDVLVKPPGDTASAGTEGPQIIIPPGTT